MDAAVLSVLDQQELAEGKVSTRLVHDLKLGIHSMNNGHVDGYICVLDI
jgi:hypothetical protein